MKKSFLLIVLLVCALVVAGCSSAMPAAKTDLTADKTAQEIVEESFDKWYSLNNYEMDLTTNIKMIMEETIDMSMSGKAVVFQSPMKMKMVLDAFIPGIEEEMQIEQYLVQEDQAITVYQSINGQWFKTVIDDPAMAEMMQMDPRDNLKLFMDNLLSAEITGQEKVGEKDTVKIDLVASAEIFDDVLQDVAGESLGLGSDIITSEFFSKIGDMKHTIWIDKATLETVKCYMDLTDNMKNLGSAFAEDSSTPEELTGVFENMEISMEYTIYNQGEAEDFSLPEEAKNAAEMPVENL